MKIPKSYCYLSTQNLLISKLKLFEIFTIFCQEHKLVKIIGNKVRQNHRSYRDESCQTYEIKLDKHCHTKWLGCTLFTLIGYGLSKGSE